MGIIKNYHNHIWVPWSHRIDQFCIGKPILGRLKYLFDIHFTILGLLGIMATPKGDLDCYIYIFKRSRHTRYSKYSYETRYRMAWRMFKGAFK